MVKILLGALLCTPLMAQVWADFYPQAGIMIGQFQQYAVKVTNASDNPMEVQGVLVWNQAKERGGFIPQLTSTVLAEKDKGTKVSWKARFLQGCAVVSAAGTAGVVTKVLGEIKVDESTGKIIVTTGTTLATLCAFGSTAVDKIPEIDVDVQLEKMIPAYIKLAAHGSADYIMWGVPITEN